MIYPLWRGHEGSTWREERRAQGRQERGRQFNHGRRPFQGEGPLLYNTHSREVSMDKNDLVGRIQCLSLGKHTSKSWSVSHIARGWLGKATKVKISHSLKWRKINFPMIQQALTMGKHQRDKGENVGGSLIGGCFLTLTLTIMLNVNFHTGKIGIKPSIFQKEFLM